MSLTDYAIAHAVIMYNQVSIIVLDFSRNTW